MARHLVSSPPDIPDYHITYKVKPFDVEEAKEIIKTKPQQLSQEEMFIGSPDLRARQQGV